MTASHAAPRPAEIAGEKDAASVTIETPLCVDELTRFTADIERLFRINPLVEYETFEALGEGQYRIVSRNLANGRDEDRVIEVSRSANGIDIVYRRGLKTRTSLCIEPSGAASRLVITDVYGSGSDKERRSRLGEVDTTLVPWGRALHDYLRRWSRWRWLAPWRWYMSRVWQPMKPSARRIVYMLWAIASFEVLALAAVLVVWAVARRTPL